MEKDTIFRKENQISNLASIYEHLVLKYLIALWKSFICDDLIELMLKQTLLYGRQEKNIDFDITAGELLSFFGIIFLQAITVFHLSNFLSLINRI